MSDYMNRIGLSEKTSVNKLYTMLDKTSTKWNNTHTPTEAVANYLSQLLCIDCSSIPIPALNIK